MWKTKMTSRQSERYGPMLFDASDVTTLLRREGLLVQASDQKAGTLKPTQVLSPSQVLSAALGRQYCYRTTQTYCKLPAVLPGILGSVPTPISLPS